MIGNRRCRGPRAYGGHRTFHWRTSNSRLRMSTGRRSHPGHHGTREISPPPPKKSCLNCGRNAVARVATQIRTDHWRLAVFFKSIRKRGDDNCWFCQPERRQRMTRTHALPHRGNARLVEARRMAWELGDKPLGSLKFCSPTHDGVSAAQVPGTLRSRRGEEGGANEEERRATRLDGWIAWEAEERVTGDL